MNGEPYQYNPNEWVYKRSMTVQEVCAYLLSHAPADAILTICGDENIHFHMSNDKAYVTLDHDSLSDIDEYDGHTEKEL